MRAHIQQGDVSIPVLTVSERATVCKRLDAASRAQLLIDLEDSGAGEAAKYRELRLFDRYRNNPADLVSYAVTMDGAIDIIETALNDRPETIDDLELDPRDSMLRLSLGLIGVDFEREFKNQPEAEAEADPMPSGNLVAASG